MNNQWIQDIKLNIVNHGEHDILKKFEKFISDHGSKIRFEPSSTVIENCIDYVWYNHLYMSWINMNKDQILIVAIYKHRAYYWTYPTYSKYLNPEPGDYTSIKHLKESDFPEPNVKIVHGEEL